METLAVVGDLYTFLATGADTGEAYATMEAVVSPGMGPPPHIHRREEESFYVLEGEVAFYVEEARQVAGAGTFLRVPIGVRHRFQNETSEPARMLITVVPAGLERMFREVGTPVAPGQPAAPPSPAEIERLVARAPEYGIELL